MDNAPGGHITPSNALEEFKIKKVDMLCVKPRKGYKPRFLQARKKVEFEGPELPAKKEVKVKAFKGLTEMVEELKAQGVQLQKEEEPYNSRVDLAETK